MNFDIDVCQSIEPNKENLPGIKWKNNDQVTYPIKIVEWTDSQIGPQPWHTISEQNNYCPKIVSVGQVTEETDDHITLYSSVIFYKETDQLPAGTGSITIPKKCIVSISDLMTFVEWSQESAMKEWDATAEKQVMAGSPSVLDPVSSSIKLPKNNWETPYKAPDLSEFEKLNPGKVYMPYEFKKCEPKVFDSEKKYIHKNDEPPAQRFVEKGIEITRPPLIGESGYFALSKVLSDIEINNLSPENRKEYLRQHPERATTSEVKHDPNIPSTKTMTNDAPIRMKHALANIASFVVSNDETILEWVEEYAENKMPFSEFVERTGMKLGEVFRKSPTASETEQQVVTRILAKEVINGIDRIQKLYEKVMKEEIDIPEFARQLSDIIKTIK